MSSFVTQFLAGSATAGALTYIFHDTITSRTNQLSLDLKELSARLNSLTMTPTTAIPTYLETGTKSIPLKEAIKSRWNETVLESVETIQNVDWNKVASKGYKNMTELGSWAKSKLDS